MSFSLFRCNYTPLHLGWGRGVAADTESTGHLSRAAPVLSDGMCVTLFDHNLWHGAHQGPLHISCLGGVGRVPRSQWSRIMRITAGGGGLRPPCFLVFSKLDLKAKDCRVMEPNDGQLDFRVTAQRRALQGRCETLNSLCEQGMPTVVRHHSVGLSFVGARVH